jgi:hypothetical protein
MSICHGRKHRLAQLRGPQSRMNDILRSAMLDQLQRDDLAARRPR